MSGVKLWVRLPLIPVILNVKLPGEAPGAALNDNGDVAVPPAVGVTGVESVNVTPAGAVPTHDPVSVTGTLKLLIEVIVIVAELLPPCAIDIVEVEEEIEKSGPAETVRLRVYE